METAVVRSDVDSIVDHTKIDRTLEKCLEREIRAYVNQLAGEIEPVNLYDLVIDRVEKQVISEALRMSDGCKTQAAKILGINRGTLRTKIKKYRL